MNKHDTSASKASPSLASPGLIFNEQGLPISQQYDDPYFSVDDGLNESRYVFLQHNHIAERLAQAATDNKNTPYKAFNIVETGFGTGLNFLLTWQLFQQVSSNQQWLHFTSIEKHPLNQQELQQALALWPELKAFTEQLLAQYPLPIKGFHQLIWPEQRVQLTLIFDDVHNALPQLSGPVHAWYLDGFAPSKNPDMWTPELFQQMRRLASRHAQEPCTVATFTAAGIVRRGLMGVGFHIEKTPGFGRKREMLAGDYQQTIGAERPARFTHKPWRLNKTKNRVDINSDVTVIGAGLAGSSTAYALAQQGFKVRVLDETGIAAGASGNPQGGLYVKLAASQNAAHTEFYLTAFQYAVRHIQQLGLSETEADFCGVLQLAYDDKEAQRQQKFLATHTLPSDLVSSMSAEQASDTAGCPQEAGGLFFPKAGWIDPRALCRAWLSHPNIQVEHQQIQELAQPAQEDRHWQLTTDKGQILTADTLVIANAFDAKQLLPDAYLPIKRIRGQLSMLDASLVPDINCVLCAQGYMAPAVNGQLCLGATYNLNDDNAQLTAQDHQTNITHLQDFGAAWAQLPDDALINGRVSFRCTTPDYLPMIGSVPDSQAFIHAFQPMVKNAKHIPAIEAPVLPNLWLNIGHGSRGLASTPLTAQLLAAQISGNAIHVSEDMAEHLWPGRFLLRDMVRKKVS